MQFICSVSFSEDSVVLVSTSVDGLVTVWDVVAIDASDSDGDGDGDGEGEGEGAAAAGGAAVAQPVDLEARFVKSKFRTRHSRVLAARFTSKNLLLVAAAYNPEVTHARHTV